MGVKIPWAKPESICEMPGHKDFLGIVRVFSYLGYGWMQQVVELEWARYLKLVHNQETGAWGPYTHNTEIHRLEAEVERLEAEVESLKQQLAARA